MHSNKKLSFSVKLLPFAFTIHNCEELWAISILENNFGSPFLVSNLQFAIAVGLFSILGFVLVFGKRLYRNNNQYSYAVLGFAGMLFLNSFFPHILSAILFKTYTPGCISAFFIILPLTSYILIKMYKLKMFPITKFIKSIICGAIIGLILVFIFLGIGYLFTKFL